MQVALFDKGYSSVGKFPKTLSNRAVSRHVKFFGETQKADDQVKIQATETKVSEVPSKKPAPKEKHDSLFAVTPWLFSNRRALNALKAGKKKRFEFFNKIVNEKGKFLNFQNADLSGLDLSGLAFDEDNFEGANLSGANLQGSSLIDTRLAKATLEGANLMDAKLQQVRWENANLDRANLSGLTIQGQLENTSFKGSILNGVTFINTHNIGGKLNAQGVQAEGARFVDMDLHQANFEGANLRGADFSGCNLSQASFKGADLTGAIFENASLRNTDFADAILKDTVMDASRSILGQSVKQLQAKGFEWIPNDANDFYDILNNLKQDDVREAMLDKAQGVIVAYAEYEDAISEGFAYKVPVFSRDEHSSNQPGMVLYPTPESMVKAGRLSWQSKVAVAFVPVSDTGMTDILQAGKTFRAPAMIIGKVVDMKQHVPQAVVETASKAGRMEQVASEKAPVEETTQPAIEPAKPSVSEGDHQLIAQVSAAFLSCMER